MKIVATIAGIILFLILASIVGAMFLTCSRIGPDAGTIGGRSDVGISQEMAGDAR